MPRVTIDVKVSVAGGQSVIASSGVIASEAIGEIHKDLLADDSEVSIEIQPSASGQLHALMLYSTHYGPDLTYVFSDGITDAATPLTLDGPQIYSGGNLVAIGVNPIQVKFTMASSGQDATVSIFVARDATP